jgi:predicted ATP-grasp superfamily ATP-dependent carboligase
VAELGTEFLRAVGLVGLANVEFKYDARDNSYKVIECNHRLTLTSVLARIAGIDSAYLAYQRALGRPTGRRFTYKPGVHMVYPLYDLRAFAAYRAKGELSLGDWVKSLLHQQHVPLFRWSDPAPALRLYWIRARRGKDKIASLFGRTKKTQLIKA